MIKVYAQAIAFELQQGSPCVLTNLPNLMYKNPLEQPTFFPVYIQNYSGYIRLKFSDVK